MRGRLAPDARVAMVCPSSMLIPGPVAGDAAPARGELPHNGHKHVTQSPLAFPEGPETPPWGRLEAVAGGS